MLIAIIFLLLGIVSLSVKCDGSNEEACQSWYNLQKEAESLTDVSLLCKINEYCTGLSCDGKLEGYKGKLEVRIEHCNPPVTLQIHLSVPKLNILDWSPIFVKGGCVPIPISNFDLPSTDDKSFLEVYFEPVNQSGVTVGISIITGPLLGHGSENSVKVVLLKNETIKFPSCPDKKIDISSVLRKEAVFRLADSRSVKNLNIRDNQNENSNQADKTCTASTLGSCGFGEYCNFVTASQLTGVCICLPNYHRNLSGICQSIPIVPSSTVGPASGTSHTDAAPTQSPSQTTLSIALPVTILIVLSTLVVLAYKYRWVMRLRARFMPSRRYEEMVIDGDEVGTINSSGSDPVA